MTEAQKLYRSAMLMLAQREHAVQELLFKLQQKGFDADAISCLLQDLQNKDWLSDQRYCAAYLRSRSQRGYGLYHIQNSLKQKGISADMLYQALSDEPIDWYALAIKVLHKRFGSDKPQDFKSRQKQQRFLRQRGFSSEQIQIALNP